MKRLVLFSFLAIFFVLSLCSLARADIQGTVYQGSENTPFSDMTVRFYSNSSSYDVNTDLNGNYYLNTSDIFINDEPDYYFNYIEVLDKSNNILTKTFLSNNFTNNQDLGLRIHINKFESSTNSISVSSAISEYEPPNYLFYYPAHINSSNRPVLLVHGWQNTYTANSDSNWGSFENELKKQNEVWRLQYWPANLSNEKNAAMVGSAIQSVLISYSSYNKLDVISHSMGSLAVRGYIQGLGKDTNGETINYDNNIRKYVIIAGPMYGSSLANLVDHIDELNDSLSKSILTWLIDFANLNGGSEASRDLEIGSNFTWNLNRLPINRDIDYLTIVGRRPIFVPFLATIHDGEINDGLVSAFSGNLLNYDVPLVILDRTHSTIISSVTGNYGIKEDAVAAKISSLFLQEKMDANTINPLLNKGTIFDGRSNEVYYNPKENLSNQLPEELKSKGSLVLKILSNNLIISNTSIKNQQGTNIFNLGRNLNTGRWYYLNKLATLGNSTNLLPINNYTLKMNEISYPVPLQINPGQVTLFTADLIPPSVALLSPLNKSYTRLPINYFLANLTDNYELANTNLYIWNRTFLTGTNFTFVSGTNNITNLSFEFSSEGIYYWNYQVNDTGMNSVFGDNNLSITYDATPPLIYFISPTPISGYYNSNNFSLEVFVNDTLSGLANSTIKLYNSTSLIKETSRSYEGSGSASGGGSGNGSSLPDGNYSFNASAFDFAGNVNSTETRNIVIDTTPPLMSNSSIKNGSTKTNLSNLIINFSDISGVDFSQTKFNITLNNLSYSDYTISNLSNSLIIAFTKIHNGDYRIDVIATDILNNTGNLTSLYFTKLNSISDINTNIENISMIIGNSKNVSQSFAGLQNISFMQNNFSILSVIWNYSYGNLDLSNISIIKQDANVTEGSLIISGIDLTLQNQTKAVYVDKISSTANKICIKDQEIASISEVSSSCDGANEISIQCPGNSGQYACELVDNNTRYKISGLSHSGVKEYTFTEPVSQPPPSVSPGGGGGSSPTVKPVVKTTNVTSNRSSVVNTSQINTGTSKSSNTSTSNQTNQTGARAGITGAVTGIGKGIKNNWYYLLIFGLVVVGAWVGLNVVRKKKA